MNLPPPFPTGFFPYRLQDEGWWLIMGDIHLPYHDRRAIELAVKTGRKNKVSGVLLNGDILDSHSISRFDRDPTRPRYIAERNAYLLLQAYLREKFPKARIVFKEGNHDERLAKYLMRHAPEIYELPELQLPSLLKLEENGVEHVGEKRVVELGKLNVLHGHEYTGGAASVNPARWLFLKSNSVALCNHFHRKNEHIQPDIKGKSKAAWAVACLCQLNPPYMPLNTWQHGFAMERVYKGGDFEVRNHLIMDGKVV